MKLLRLILFPFSILYGIITGIRNFMYDKGFLKSYSFPVPVIAVGNLSTGGTGKSPQAEYLIRLLAPHYRVATLSRGYKRKSIGFVLADANSNADVLGDEPYQFYTKFPDIAVAVDANRKNGIGQLLELRVKPEVILLDDAYQHRRVKAGFYILLTAYGDVYADDYLLPSGNLREGRLGAGRANIIVVTKCPPDISIEEQDKIRYKLNPLPNQEVYFSCISYDTYIYSAQGKLAVEDIRLQQKVLIAGIAKPAPFFDWVKSSNDIVLAYSDHHNFTEREILEITEKSKNKIIITTEKDYMRLKGKLPGDKLFYLPIKSTFIEGSGDFDSAVLNFTKNTAIFPGNDFR